MLFIFQNIPINYEMQGKIILAVLCFKTLNCSARIKSKLNVKYKLTDITLHSGDLKLNIYPAKLVGVSN